MKDVLVFESEAFSIEATTEPSGAQYDLPLGDDIAAHIGEQLRAAGVPWEIDDPVREDFGAVLMLSRGKSTFTVTVSWQGGYDWALVFDQMRGCIGWLLSRKAEAEPLNEIKSLVQDVVLGDPDRFKNARWISEEEFPGVASAFLL